MITVIVGNRKQSNNCKKGHSRLLNSICISLQYTLPLQNIEMVPLKFKLFLGLLPTCGQLHCGSFDKVWDWSLGHGLGPPDGHCIDLSLGQDNQQVIL